MNIFTITGILATCCPSLNCCHLSIHITGLILGNFLSTFHASLLNLCWSVDEPCRIGCNNLSFCTNFNHRPTELYRSCSLDADLAAEKTFNVWRNGIIRLPQMTIYVKGRYMLEMYLATFFSRINVVNFTSMNSRSVCCNEILLTFQPTKEILAQFLQFFLYSKRFCGRLMKSLPSR